MIIISTRSGSSPWQTRSSWWATGSCATGAHLEEILPQILADTLSGCPVLTKRRCCCMMDTQVDRELLEKIADLIGKPVGAFNIRKDCGCDGRVSTEHIKIDDRTDGHAGIDIRILDGTKGETCHIPVIITKSGVEETVYNDFYIGEDCDVEIVAGCGIHNCGDQESRHDGIHTFHVGKNSHVHYSEKHYAEGDGRGEKIMNPQTIVYLEEGASIQMDTVQIRGVDSTKRYTKIVCGKGAEAVITERLLTHGRQVADSDMVIELNGEDAKGRVISRSVAQDESSQVFRPCVVGNAKCFGHVQCDSIIMGQAKISSVPEIAANDTEAQLIHEAAIGKIAGDQLLKLETLGLTEEEAEDRILKGFWHKDRPRGGWPEGRPPFSPPPREGLSSGGAAGAAICRPGGFSHEDGWAMRPHFLFGLAERNAAGPKRKGRFWRTPAHSRLCADGGRRIGASADLGLPSGTLSSSARS